MQFDNIQDGYIRNSQIINNGDDLIDDSFDNRSQSRSCKSTITKSKYRELNINGNTTSTFSHSKKTKFNRRGKFGNKLSQHNKIGASILNELNELQNRPFAKSVTYYLSLYLLPITIPVCVP